ncbi:hypothetical protein OKA05_03560 [Luteolibacter arcticus]|uniref:Uncharacterized protein n=1 Tax=Luteolibacter arcticus TaxID=1581411 RepID=A0ABT3GDB4_9BACT|nr:hypothetical protein [Luteolibacter arcticus]MCW1921614.1 hypothetical protein [Luteolibacter arcticus]
MKILCAVLIAVWLLSPAQAGPTAETLIPASSRSPLDFRGKSPVDYPPYAAVFQAKTYGELKERLEDFFRQWEKDKKTFTDHATVNIYFHCKNALIRTCYLLGDIEAGDEHLMKLDPGQQYLREIRRVDLEAGKIQRIAKEIQAIHLHLGLKDPFPQGAPKDLVSLYLPLAEISQVTQAQRKKEPEEELEDPE